MLTIDDFVHDQPWTEAPRPPVPRDPDWIDGVEVDPLHFNKDGRGELVELLTQRDRGVADIVHVYQVWAEPGSVRAWVYHRWQDDRLSFTNGTFRLVLYDIRKDSPTRGRLNIFDLGAANPCRITIPAFVVHGVQNRGAERASFVNCPTQFYDPARPDKSRVPADHPGVPYRFG
jgi:dTDP-4-dehydrorhamnose 3,5-epimerase